MTNEALAAWAVAAAAMITLLLMIVYRRQDGGDKKMREQLKPIVDALARHDKYHGEHYDHAKEANAALAELGQQMRDHERQDTDRFNEIRDMQQEIRSDIKELLRR